MPIDDRLRPLLHAPPGASAPRRPRERASALAEAAAEPSAAVLARMGVSAEQGLDDAVAAGRLAAEGPNRLPVRRHRVWSTVASQVRSPLLVLLLVAAVASAAVGEGGSALIIAVIVGLSAGLGFVNEYRARRTADALHAQVSHRARVVRSGRSTRVDVAELVVGDIVVLRLGDVVPADLRLVDVDGLSCDEAVLTGESGPTAKSTAPVAPATGTGDLTCCALMGTVVSAGAGRGMVVATGPDAHLGSIAAGLGEAPPETAFQQGLRSFSVFLVRVAAVLTTSIFAINLLLHRTVLDALLFSLAIAVGITPQLLPAVVATSLAAGSRSLRRRRVLVKRLVCIEDLGDVDTLFTDKTGTLTEGRITFARAVAAGEHHPDDVVGWAALCTDADAVGSGPNGAGGPGPLAGNALDQALLDSPVCTRLLPTLGPVRRLGVLPFDHRRRMVSTAVVRAGRRTLIVKGAPEAVLERCVIVPESIRTALALELDAGHRVIAVAQRPTGERPPAPADEVGLNLLGLLVFLDPPKNGAAEALARLSVLGVTVKVVTGDHPSVASKVCRDLGLPGRAVLTGADLDLLRDDALPAAIEATTVFARVSPEHKARIVAARRSDGHAVAFLGDGVNDALALHGADVGISVDSGTDVAQDAADIILLDKDLGVLADGVAEGRRIFANTVKYVLMGTSSNFGNMFSAAGASLVLPFLPMLPSQILLTNLLYDASQLALPTDHVDDEQLRRPSHWDLAFIRRFMLVFGPVSSLFDVLTFVVLLVVLDAEVREFRTGWFVESLATQTLIVFAIRTRRVPFFRSGPSAPIVVAALGAVAVGVALPLTPLAGPLGFTPLPAVFFLALAAMAAAYLVMIEVVKRSFYARLGPPRLLIGPSHGRRLLARRARRFVTVG